MSDFILTNENYYSPEADLAYMSCSQYQDFLECEAAALAKIQQRFKKEPTQAFLVGNFFHSFFESKEAHAEFCKKYTNEIYTKTSLKNYNAGKGELELLAPFQQAMEMIRTAKSDKVIAKFIDMPGENELFMTGEIFGVPWRMKMDKYVPDKRFILDYKTVASIWETSYDPVRNERVTFVEAYGYLFRAAVYSMIESQNALGIDWKTTYNGLCDGSLRLPDFMLICISKQDPPDKEIIRLNHRQAYIYELERIKDKLARIQAIKQGLILPKRCGMCEYCRMTKEIRAIIPYYELKPEFRAQKEDDYAIPQERSPAEIQQAGAI